jgi:hypothetical protein
MNISDKQVVDTGKDGSEPFRLPDGNIAGLGFTEPTITTDTGEGEEEVGIPQGEGAVSSSMPPPNNLFIDSQTVRIAPDGGAVVDIVLGFDAIEDAVGHEVRISKL